MLLFSNPSFYVYVCVYTYISICLYTHTCVCGLFYAAGFPLSAMSLSVLFLCLCVHMCAYVCACVRVCVLSFHLVFGGGALMKAQPLCLHTCWCPGCLGLVSLGLCFLDQTQKNKQKQTKKIKAPACFPNLNSFLSL